MTRMPLAFAWAMIGSKAVGLLGLMRMASTPWLMKLRNWAIWPGTSTVALWAMVLTVMPLAAQALAAASASSIIWVRHSLPTQPLLSPMTKLSLACAVIDQPPANAARIAAIKILRIFVAAPFSGDCRPASSGHIAGSWGRPRAPQAVRLATLPCLGQQKYPHRAG